MILQLKLIKVADPWIHLLTDKALKFDESVVVNSKRQVPNKKKENGNTYSRCSFM